MVEKPISAHKADAERVVAKDKEKADLVCGTMFQLRVGPRYEKIREIVLSGELGDLMRVIWIMTDWFRAEAYYQSGGWRATWKGEGGGVLLNQCLHQLDALQWITGMPSKIRSHLGSGKYHDIEVEDDVTAYAEYENGATGVFITTTGEAPGTNRMEITGDNGKVVMENGQITFWRNRTSAAVFNREWKGGFGSPETWK